MDNPFAVERRRSSPLRAVKTLLVVVVGLVAVLGFQYGSQRWLLSRLTHDIDQQPDEVQMERLSQIAQLGSCGIPVLVAHLQSPRQRVAESAFQLLKQQQQQWVQLTDADADARHRQLTAELTALETSQLELRRGGWVALLLNHTIVETVEHPSDDAAWAYQSATALLTQLTVHDREDELVRPGQSSTRVALRTEPLPVETASAALPTEATSPTSQPAELSPAEFSPADNGNGETPTPGSQETTALRPLPTQATVPLDSPAVTRVRENASDHHVVVPIQHLSDEPFDVYTTRSVIAWLRSVQPQLRDSAHHELRRRGFDEQQLALAGRLADPDIRTRLGLLNELSRRTDVEPRQWLIWLAEDAEPEVRRRAVAALGTMRDADILQRLREQLAAERDPGVADLIRRILNQP